MTHEAYANDVHSVVEMFTDGTAGETSKYNRLATTELDSGNVGLIAYGEKIIAEYDEAERRVTVYLGHRTGGGRTISRYLNRVREEARSRRSVTLSDNAPWFRPPNDQAAQYIGSYIDFNTQLSAVERAAQETVHESLSWVENVV